MVFMNQFSEIEYLEERLEELEIAANNTQFMIENEDGAFYQSQFMKDNLTKILFEIAAVRRKLSEVQA
jgi:hypothetical protein